MTGIAATCELWVDGVRFADAAGRGPAALDDLRIDWGRDNRLDQPDAAQLTVTVLDTGTGPGRWDQVIGLGSKVAVWTDVQGTRVCPFVGRVTDVTGRYSADLGGAEVKVAAADALAEKANRFVGQEPWPMEQWYQRAWRITGQGGADWAFIPTPPSPLNVSRMDVDRQAQTTLLGDLAASGGAVIYPVMTPAGQELMVVENPTQRASLLVLGVGGDGLWRPVSGAGAGAYSLSACDVPRDPIDWTRSVVDQTTRVTVRWQDQTTSPGTTERSVSLVNTADEAAYGARGVSVGTILTTQADAQTLASAMLVRNQASDNYRAGGLVWDLARAVDPAAVLPLARRLLDSSQRSGTALLLTDLPEWTPLTADVGGYVEGGTYVYAAGRWLLSLATTPAAGAGQSFTFEQTPRPAPAYNEFAHDVSYLDLYGVGAPTTAAAGESLTGLGADPPAVAPSGTNQYGLPYPEQTDPYYATPAALTALRDAALPKMTNLPVQFFDKATYPSDANGDCRIDLSATFTRVDGVVFSDNGGGYPNLYQYVSAGQPPATVQVRILTTTPPDGNVWANASGTFAMTVWGVPR